MRKLMAAMLVLIVFACACSAAGDNKTGGSNDEAKPWDYGSGYVLDKAGERLLIVSEQFEADKSVEDVLSGGGMKAIWLAVEEEQFEAAKIGDEVRVKVVGAVAESYPEQGTGSIEFYPIVRMGQDTASTS